MGVIERVEMQLPQQTMEHVYGQDRQHYHPVTTLMFDLRLYAVSCMIELSVLC